MLTRRFFLLASSGSLLSLGIPVTAIASRTAKSINKLAINPGLEVQCDLFNSGRFVAHLNMTGLDQPYIDDPKVVQFILNFEATEPVKLDEASYQLTHPSLGQLDLFIQPCGNFEKGQHDGIRYYACMAMLQ